MYHRDLLDPPLSLQTENAMKLPQPISRISLRIFSPFVLIVFLHVPAVAAPQLTFNPTGLRFGEVVVGSAETLSATMTNSGSTSITVSTMTVEAPFIVKLSLPLTLTAGQSVSFTVTFSPTALGLNSGSLTFNGNAGYLALRGSGISQNSLTANPPSVAFGNVGTGSTGTIPVTLTNSGKASVTISQQTISGSGFAVTGLSLPLTLAAGNRFTFSVTFSPASTGSIHGSFEGLSSKSGALVGIPLSGTGTAPGQLTISPASVNFGNVTVGENSTQSGALSATGASVTVSSASSSNSQFVVNGISFPATIAAGGSLPFSVTFTPQSSGTDSATLSFASNAANSPPPESLAGTGIAQQYSVNLSWDPSTSKVNGYNVYRGGKSGGPYGKLNSSLDSTTSYTDSSVAASQTYYYVTTAVNSSGQESAYSNQVEVVIP
jgi:hypothetical protein